VAARTDHDERAGSEAGYTVSGDMPGGRRRMGWFAMTVSVFGELLITVGLVLGLFVVYSLWWTNVVADREAHKQGDKVHEKKVVVPPDWRRARLSTGRPVGTASDIDNLESALTQLVQIRARPV